MGRFKFEKCMDIEGLYTIEPEVFSDERGYNLESYNLKDFKDSSETYVGLILKCTYTRFIDAISITVL